MIVDFTHMKSDKYDASTRLLSRASTLINNLTTFLTLRSGQDIPHLGLTRF